MLLMSLIATGMCLSGKLDGGGWITTITLLTAMWQARRGWDNKLRADNGGGK